MSTTPLKRIYFDSNILRGWPHSSNEVWNAFGAANWLKTEIYFPKVVEDELESQFVRGVVGAFDGIQGHLKDLNKLCRSIIELDIKGKEPSESELRDAFRAHSNELKTHFNITTIPLTTISLDTFVDMAINRVPPFEQVAIDKNKNGVVGLQDAAILFSIVEHMHTAQEGDRCALISNDGIFYKDETRKLVARAGVKLEGMRSVGALWEDLFNHVWPSVRTPWHKEMEQIEADLNTQKEELAAQIEALLNTSEFGQDLWKRAKIVKKFSVRDFGMIKIDLPESEFRPPRATTYSRPEGSAVKISARAQTEMEAIVERTNWWSSLLGGPPSDPNATPVLEEATLSETLNVSLMGTVRNGRIDDFEVTALEPYRP